MAAPRHSGKVVYYGGYPGSSGRPVVGRLVWEDEALRFVPRGAAAPLFRIERARLLGVRRSEEGLTGARRVRLLVDARTEQGAAATLKFEMSGLLPKERKLARWLAVLGPAGAERRGDHG